MKIICQICFKIKDLRNDNNININTIDSIANVIINYLFYGEIIHFTDLHNNVDLHNNNINNLRRKSNIIKQIYYLFL